MHKTLIIGGNFRGGTTAVAAAYKAAGVFMGWRHEYTLEDFDFQDLFFPPGSTFNVQKFDRLVKVRNDAHAVWGFKYPAIWEHAESIAPKLRNPHFVFVFRDPYAIGLSEEKHTGHVLQDAVGIAARRTVDMIEAAERLMVAEWPVTCVSYEKLILEKHNTVHRLLDFIGLGIPRYDQRFIDAVDAVNVKRGYGVTLE